MIAFFILVIVLIFIVIVTIWALFPFSAKPAIIEETLCSGECGGPGTKTVRLLCPDGVNCNDNGTSFNGLLEKTVPCNPLCINTQWIDISSSPCVNGRRDVIRECRKKDDNGEDYCTEEIDSTQLSPNNIYYTPSIFSEPILIASPQNTNFPVVITHPQGTRILTSVVCNE